MKSNYNQLNLEFNILFLGKVDYLIKLIEKCKFLKMQEKIKNLIILEYNNSIIQLNLIDINKKDNNSIADCIMMMYYIDDIKSFKEIKNQWEKKLKKKAQTDLIYLIEIKKISDEENNSTGATSFSENDRINFFIIHDKNENNINNFFNDLLEQLRIRKIIVKNNLIKRPNKVQYKVCFIGSSGSGAKSSLINAIKGKKFDFCITSTNSCSFTTKTIKFNGENIDLNLWDTIGQEKFRPLTKMFIKDSDCIVIGFDITDNSSFGEIKDWYKIAKDNCEAKLMYLIGNKIDLHTERKITEEKARNLANDLNLRYFETSCLTREGIYNFMYDLANEIIKY